MFIQTQKKKYDKYSQFTLNFGYSYMKIYFGHGPTSVCINSTYLFLLETIERKKNGETKKISSDIWCAR